MENFVLAIEGATDAEFQEFCMQSAMSFYMKRVKERILNWGR